MECETIVCVGVNPNNNECIYKHKTEKVGNFSGGNRKKSQNMVGRMLNIQSERTYGGTS